MTNRGPFMASLKRIAAGGAALVICPCHVLYGAAALAAGAMGVAAPAAPEVQDGLHAVYLASMGLGVALWLRRGRSRSAARDQAGERPALARPERGPGMEHG